MKNIVRKSYAIAVLSCFSTVMPMAGGDVLAGADPFTTFDRNENGVIEADEFPGSSERFKELDTNSDGVLSRLELRSTNPPLQTSKDKGKGEPPGDHGPGKGDGPGGFEKDDDNGDGKVTREEFSGPDDLFSKLDANGDGVLTQDEVGKPPEGNNGPGGMGGPPRF